MSEDRNKEKVDFLKWQLEYVIDQIKMADTKINFLLAIYLALLGITVSQTKKIANIFLDACVSWEWKVFTGIIYFLFLYCIVRFYCYFVKVVKPRVNPKDILKEENYRSLIFWGDIANMKFEEFNNAELERRYNDLEKQVFINSCIAESKFGYVTKAYKIFTPTLVIFMVLLILIGF